MVESSDYLRALAESAKHHEGSKTFSGRFLRPHGPPIKDIIARLDCKSILDYGCGKGEQYRWVIPDLGQTLEQYWGIEAAKFDPAYKPYSAQPNGQYDLVLCTHVLGSIPVSDLGWVIDRLYEHASKALYVVEKIGPVKKKVFSKTDVMPLGWDEERWMRALARKSPVEVHFVAHRRGPDGKSTRCWQIRDGSFYAVGGSLPLNHYLAAIDANR